LCADKERKLPTLSEDTPSDGSDSNSSDTNSQNDVVLLSEAEPIYPVFFAKYDYTSEDISFKSGDQLFIINDDNKDWWYARAKDSGEEGHVPSNYVAKSSLDAEE